MTERKSGKSKKTHKEKAEKVNLREAAQALKAAETTLEKKKVSLSSAARASEHEAEVIYAPEPMPAAEPKPASRALVATPKTAGDDAAETFKQSLTAAQKSASAVNAKLLDIAQEAMNANLEHARDLAGITNPMQAVKLQMKHWQETIESFTANSQELRTLTTELVATSSEPIRAHMRRKLSERAR